MFLLRSLKSRLKTNLLRLLQKEELNKKNLIKQPKQFVMKDVVFGLFTVNQKKTKLIQTRL